MHEFNLVNEYMFSRLGVNPTNICENVVIVETDRRLCREMSYGFIHMIWIVEFYSGLRIASIPLNVSDYIKSYLQENITNSDITANSFVLPLKKLADEEAKRLFNKESCRCFTDLVFACNSRTIALNNSNVKTYRLTDRTIECAADIGFPDHCLPDGIIYGVIEDNKIVSLAHAHKTGKYENIVADIGVETSKRYRKRGYAKECVHSVAKHIINNNGESVYKCSPENIASIKTALTVGYEPYGKSLIFSVVPE